ncbi:ferrochelatase [Candidatus Thioglobus autotrophicus]|uniref:ferrochelatase n=1 Tax=Candidatus Thioglobus autotrophicus TaxID=1705394 RepID=UPI0038505BA8
MKTGILLTNLGTPDEPTKPALKRYLSEFLSDPRVVDPPNKFIWWLALNLVILNIRPKKSALNYAKIWDSFGTGSPLLNITQSQLKGVQEYLSKKCSDLEFEMGMRYGNPSIASALNKLKARGCSKIIVLPLYPQYSKTTTLSTLDAINLELKTWSSKPEIVFIEHYYQNKAYLQALSSSIKEYQDEHGVPDKLLISFHGTFLSAMLIMAMYTISIACKQLICWPNRLICKRVNGRQAFNQFLVERNGLSLILKTP